MTTLPALLIASRALAPVAPFLDVGYRVFRQWDSLADDVAGEIAAVVVAGEDVLDTALLEHLPSLRHIACFTSGYDGIDLDWCRSRGLVVTHAPAVNHEDVADHALALILAARRRIVDGDRIVRAGGWVMEQRLITPSMRGCRIGIVGLGAIGEALAQRVAVMGCEVRWWGPRDKPGAAWPRVGSLVDLAETSDVLVVACRADTANRGLISAGVIAALGADGLLVNVARGSLVDEDALIIALKAGRLGGAALDVFETEPTPADRWDGVPNVVLTPHTAGATMQAVQGMLALLIRNLEAVAAGGPPVTPVP
jgi:lactate dehydrogenase-like 2-hydroxyacid dehydrogenase